MGVREGARNTEMEEKRKTEWNDKRKMERERKRENLRVIKAKLNLCLIN
jgi:hypothetical protein